MSMKSAARVAHRHLAKTASGLVWDQQLHEFSPRELERLMLQRHPKAVPGSLIIGRKVEHGVKSLKVSLDMELDDPDSEYNAVTGTVFVELVPMRNAVRVLASVKVHE